MTIAIGSAPLVQPTARHGDRVSYLGKEPKIGGGGARRNAPQHVSDLELKGLALRSKPGNELRGAAEKVGIKIRFDLLFDAR